MRPSNRTRILEAAFRVIEREGVTGLTFDSVAAEAELTRGGLIYHFPSREALIEAVHQHLAGKWQDSMLAIVGKPLEQTTAEERYTAYAKACCQSATRAELLFLLDSSTSPDLAASWLKVLETWGPPSPDEDPDPRALSRFLARLAADGLWVYESISYKPLSPEVRGKIIDALEKIIRDDRLPP